MVAGSMTAPTIEELRARHYNAAVAEVRQPDGETLVLRVRPDTPVVPVKAGQAVSVGLGRWEERCDEVPVTFDPEARTPLIRRSYSVAASMIDARGTLVTAGAGGVLELWVTLITSETDDPSRLTPRLFHLGANDRLFIAPKSFGRYGIEGVAGDDDVLLLATGTGEAPHTAMIAALLAGGHRGRIAAVTSARRRSNLAYLEAHRALERLFPSYRYVAVTTRERGNLEASHLGFVGRKHIQDLFVSGELGERIGWTPQPGQTHVFLCGRPEFLGVKPAAEGSETGMVPLLEAAGFPAERIHTERYW